MFSSLVVSFKKQNETKRNNLHRQVCFVVYLAEDKWKITEGAKAWPLLITERSPGAVACRERPTTNCLSKWKGAWMRAGRPRPWEEGGPGSGRRCEPLVKFRDLLSLCIESQSSPQPCLRKTGRRIPEWQHHRWPQASTPHSGGTRRGPLGYSRVVGRGRPVSGLVGSISTPACCFAFTRFISKPLGRRGVSSGNSCGSMEELPVFSRA